MSDELEDELEIETGFTRDQREVLSRIWAHGLTLASPINEIARTIPAHLFFFATNLHEEYRRYEKHHQDDTPVGPQEGGDWD